MSLKLRPFRYCIVWAPGLCEVGWNVTDQSGRQIKIILGFGTSEADALARTQVLDGWAQKRVPDEVMTAIRKQHPSLPSPGFRSSVPELPPSPEPPPSPPPSSIFEAALQRTVNKCFLLGVSHGRNGAAVPPTREQISALVDADYVASMLEAFSTMTTTEFEREMQAARDGGVSDEAILHLLSVVEKKLASQGPAPGD